MIGVTVQMRRGHRDDKARGAEPALRSVVIDHRLLHRVQRAIGAADTFDRTHRLALQLWQKKNAGVQRPRALLIGDHNGAGTAVAFIAAFLGAGQAARLAQPIQ